MYITFSGNGENTTLQLQRQHVSRRQSRIEQFRARRTEQELGVQEGEKARIQKINDRIGQAAGHIQALRQQLSNAAMAQAKRDRGEEYDAEALKIDTSAVSQEIESRYTMMDMLAEQITQIHEQRAQREALALELGARDMQARLEERIREREEAAEERAENQSAPIREREAAEQAAERDVIKNLARIDANAQTIHYLAHVRGLRSREALLLRHAVDSDNSFGLKNVLGPMQFIQSTARVPNGRADANDFRNSHLRKLEEGVARLDEAIMQRVMDMYRRGMAIGEALKEEREATDCEDED
ncbi:MAG: hypothetical protein FWB88_10340 [Defluviitaleaceae bacterium]|nr:hypothetical protein [Defluviitaleaceae bacterium]MCL2240767.1 hypothetical protein [Defluviitaleaceae bacterium]